MDDLYVPLQRSCILNGYYELILPHLTTREQYNSREILCNKKCVLVIAEVSNPSHGVGIEMAWAEYNGIPVIAVYKEGSRPSKALRAVCRDFIPYVDTESLVTKVEQCVVSMIHNH